MERVIVVLNALSRWTAPWACVEDAVGWYGHGGMYSPKNGDYVAL